MRTVPSTIPQVPTLPTSDSGTAIVQPYYNSCGVIKLEAEASSILLPTHVGCYWDDATTGGSTIVLVSPANFATGEAASLCVPVPGGDLVTVNGAYPEITPLDPSYSGNWDPLEHYSYGDIVSWLPAYTSESKSYTYGAVVYQYSSHERVPPGTPPPNDALHWTQILAGFCILKPVQPFNIDTYWSYEVRSQPALAYPGITYYSPTY